MDSAEKIIVGLGNPGSAYRFNRHNVGFLLLEEIYNDPEIKFGAIKKRKNAFLTMGDFDGVSFTMVQQRVFMNSSGALFYDLEGVFDLQNMDIMVMHDDISFEIGKIKLKQNGGDGGHKGVRSIIEALDSKNFSRLKIGIRNPEISVLDLSEYVLENFTREELRILSSVFPMAIEAVKVWLKEGIEVAMNRFNVRKELEVNNG